MESHKSIFRLITARNEVGAKLCFLHMSVILFTGGKGWYPSMHCRWYPRMPCSRSRGGGFWYPSMPCRFPSPHPREKLRGLACGRGRGFSRPTPRGSPGPHLGGSQPWGDLQAYTWGCIPACTEADPPMATAVGGTHPTGMHSCSYL